VPLVAWGKPGVRVTVVAIALAGSAMTLPPAGEVRVVLCVLVSAWTMGLFGVTVHLDRIVPLGIRCVLLERSIPEVRDAIMSRGIVQVPDDLSRHTAHFRKGVGYDTVL